MFGALCECTDWSCVLLFVFLLTIVTPCTHLSARTLPALHPSFPPSPLESQPVVLVDGYNLCGAWPKLKKHFLRGDLEEARERLISEVLPYRSYAGENAPHPGVPRCTAAQ